MSLEAAGGPISEERGSWKVLLAISSGLLLGISFPPSPFYSVAYVALIPLLVLLAKLKTFSEILRLSYLTLFVFHLITLYWVGGFTHGKDPYLMTSGAALLLVHPMFYWLPVAGFVFVRRSMGSQMALIALPFLWTSFDYVHALGEFSFPWLTLGNSQAYDLYRLQLVEYTSVYGLTFLIVTFNSLGFLLLDQVTSKAWNLRSVRLQGTILALLILYLVPYVYGKSRLSAVSGLGAGQSVRVGIVQPNIDPWEKWGEGSLSKWESYQRQFDVLFALTDSLNAGTKDLVVWPETAIPFDIFLPQNSKYYTLLREIVDSLRINVFTGMPHVAYFDSPHAPSTAKRITGTQVFYEWYNAALLLSPGGSDRTVYKKIVLVPFAERVPYADVLTFLVEPLKWSVGISGWGKGRDTTVFRLSLKDSAEVFFSGMICYESIFPQYVREFAKRNAQFLVIVTNDSWWGNTSGAYQHAAYASFRAVENRRWIIRCANGGISALVDPFGRLLNASDMYTQTTISGVIEARGDQTFYVRHGDVFAQVSLFCTSLVLIMSVLQRFRKRRSEERELDRPAE